MDINFISDDDDEEIVDFINSNFYNRGIFERKNHFDTMRDGNFLRRFRLTKTTTLCLLEEIEDKLEFKSDRNNSVSPINQLLCALQFYATGSQLITCGDMMGVHESTACRILHRVTHAIAQLRPKYIQFPETTAEQQKVATEFYSVARFPRVIGAIDCTHVRIQSPGGENSVIFRNRKGYFSFNVQAICKANLTFTDVVARWHGSAHDANIWDNCSQKRNFLQNLHGDMLLLGDSGYAQTAFLMTPLSNTQNRAEALYQEAQIRSRNVIERAFGVWKRRFPILSRGINIKLRRIPGIIISTAVLHNIALSQGDVLPPYDPDFPPLIEPIDLQAVDGQNNVVHRNTGQRERQVLIEQHFARL